MTTGGRGDDELSIRPPTQARSRAAWRRVLDAGVALLEDEGYEAFTIAAVCARAQVAPPAIYARAPSKDALYLAVYEHAMATIRAEQSVLTDLDRWRSCSDEEVVRGAVRELAALFRAHDRLLRSVVRTSGVHPEVLRRGGEYSRQLGAQFVALVETRADALVRPDATGAAWHCFNVVFATCAIRISNGPDFAARAVDEETFVAQLGDLAAAYLLGLEPRPT